MACELLTGPDKFNCDFHGEITTDNILCFSKYPFTSADGDWRSKPENWTFHCVFCIGKLLDRCLPLSNVQLVVPGSSQEPEP